MQFNNIILRRGSGVFLMLCLICSGVTAFAAPPTAQYSQSTFEPIIGTALSGSFMKRTTVFSPVYKDLITANPSGEVVVDTTAIPANNLGITVAARFKLAPTASAGSAESIQSISLGRGNSPADFISRYGNGIAFEDMALKFYYSPLLKRDILNVGIVFSPQTVQSGYTSVLSSVQIPISNYTDTSTFVFNGTDWRYIVVPLTDFLDTSKATYYPGNTTIGAFIEGSQLPVADFSHFIGICISADSANLSGQTAFCRLAKIEFVKMFPAMPSNLKATDSTTSTISLEWSENTKPITPTGYYVWREDTTTNVSTKIATISETHYTDAQLDIGTSYNYYVQAYSSSGVSDPIKLATKTKGYFATTPQKGVYVTQMTINDAEPTAQTKLKSGANNVYAMIKSADYAGSLTFCVGLYDGNQLVDLQTILTNPVTVGGSAVVGPYNMTVPNMTDHNYNIRMFAVNSLGEMNLLSQIYTLDKDKLNEFYYNLDDYTIKTADVNYDISKFSFKISGTTDMVENSIVTATILPSNVDFATATANDIAYISNIPIVDGAFSQNDITLNESKFSNGSYTVYFTTPIGVIKDTVVIPNYASETTIRKIISDTLNVPNLTPEAADVALRNPDIGIDLTYYNIACQNSATKSCALTLFLSEAKQTFTTPTSVQNVIDKAAKATIILSETNVTHLDDFGETIALEGTIFNQYKTGKITATSTSSTRDIKNISAIKEKTVQLLKAHTINLSTATYADINTAFVDSFIPAVLSDDTLSYYTFGELIEKYFTSYLTIDTTKANGIDSADIYKAMVGNTYTTISSVNTKYDEVLNALIAASKKIPDVSGRGGHSGGTSITTSPINPPKDIPQKTDFKDIDTVSWAVEGIQELVSKNIIAKGDYFRPNDSITREEFVKMIVLAYYTVDKTSNCDFTDIKKSDWSYSYIATAKEKGIISGISQEQFGVGANITREDMATIIYRILTELGKTGTIGTVDGFHDEDDIAQYAISAVHAMKALGIINGSGNNEFNPKSFATRAEVAKIIYSAIQGGAK